MNSSLTEAERSFTMVPYQNLNSSARSVFNVHNALARIISPVLFLICVLQGVILGASVWRVTGSLSLAVPTMFGTSCIALISTILALLVMDSKKLLYSELFKSIDAREARIVRDFENVQHVYPEVMARYLYRLAKRVEEACAHEDQANRDISKLSTDAKLSRDEFLEADADYKSKIANLSEDVSLAKKRFFEEVAEIYDEAIPGWAMIPSWFPERPLRWREALAFQEWAEQHSRIAWFRP